jgi:hypothetical protein
MLNVIASPMLTLSTAVTRYCCACPTTNLCCTVVCIFAASLESSLSASITHCFMLAAVEVSNNPKWTGNFTDVEVPGESKSRQSERHLFLADELRGCKQPL